MNRSVLLAWIRAFRPLTLTASVIPVTVAHCWVLRENQQVHWVWSWLALLSACLIQVGTNLYNDVVDAREGVDTEDRAGPRRLIQSGIARAATVAKAAHLCFLLAVLCGIPLVLHGGLPILVIGTLSVVCGYGYSSPPLKLSYRGLSELFVVFFFGLLAMFGVVWLHCGALFYDPLLIGLILGLLSTNLLVINNIRDCNTDREAGKHTLVARFGRSFGEQELVISGLICALAIMAWSVRYFPPAALTIACLFPLLIALKIVKATPQNHRAMVFAALSHLSFGMVSAFLLVTL